MNPVRAALYTALAADDDLGNLLSSPEAIYPRRAPQGAAQPYVVFSKQAGTPEGAMQDPKALQHDVWLVKGVGKSAGAVEAIDARLDVVLADAELAIDGHEHLYLRRESDLDYPEDKGNETWHHVGGLYRLIAEPTI